MKLFTTHDSKAKAYLQPFFMRSKGEAIRGFSELANEEGHQFKKYPEDFTLFYLGEYNEETGIITPLKTPESLGKALDFVKPEAELLHNKVR